jgi:outer membrane protein TolC
MIAMHSKTLLLFATLAFAGCVLPPKETAHPEKLAKETMGLTGAAVQPAADGWWDSFQDPQLDRLIRLGLSDNPTLTQARARVSLALAQTQSAQAALLPSANLDASALYQRAPQNYLIPPPLAGHSFWMAQAGASLGWDLDFWGRQSDAVHRAQDLAQSASFDEDNARLMLAGAMAQAYIELYRENALADIAQRSELQRQNIVDITRRRVAAGLDTQLEIREAEGELPQAAKAMAAVTRVTTRPILSLRPSEGRFRLLGMRQPAIGWLRWGGLVPHLRPGHEVPDPGSRKKSRKF